MKNKLLLRVITPRRPILEKEVDEVTAPGSVGEFGVLPQHVTFLSSLETGVLYYRDAGRQAAIAIRGGFAEVRDDVVTVLADEAQSAEEISPEAARSDIARADAEIRQAAEGSPAWFDAVDRKRWAEVRLAATRRAMST